MRLQVTEMGINEEVQVKATKAIAWDNEKLRRDNKEVRRDVLELRKVL